MIDERSQAPLPGAVVTLIDRNGERRAEDIADSVGHFRLVPPEAGEYILQALQFGYERARSPLLSLTTEGSASIELTMQPIPVGLPGLEVTVEKMAEEFLRPFGHTPASLGLRWIDKEDIEKMPLQVTTAGVIKWRAIPGVWVASADPGNPMSGLCVTFVRTGHRGCALVALNGVPISVEEAGNIDPYSIEAIAILRPVDAVTFFGTQGGNGAVMIWTRRGGR